MSRYKGRHRRPSTTRRNTAVAVTAGAAVVLPVLAPAAASAAELAPSVDWAPIIACESGGNPTIKNSSSSASGLFQIIDGTWKAYGGATAHAYQASVAEQTAVANRIYAAEGLGPWAASKSCWAGKIGTTPAVPRTGVAKPPKTAEKTAPRVEALPDAKRDKASWADSAATYTVHKGDTLSKIARAHGKPSWRDVYERNRGVVGGNPNLIMPGQQLQL